MTADLALTPADAVLSSPSGLDIQMIGDVHHSKGIGAAHYYPIVAPGKLSPIGWLYYLVGSKEMNRFMSYWTIGARQKHQSFGKFDIFGVIFKRTFVVISKNKEGANAGGPRHALCNRQDD